MHQGLGSTRLQARRQKEADMNRAQVEKAIKALGLSGRVTTVAIWEDKVVWETLEYNPLDEYDDYVSHEARIDE